MSDAPLLEYFPGIKNADNIIDFPGQRYSLVDDFVARISRKYWDLMTADQLEIAREHAEQVGDDFVKLQMVHYNEDGTSKSSEYSMYRNPETGEYLFNPPAYLIDEIAAELWIGDRLAEQAEAGLQLIYEVLVEVGYQPLVVIRKLQMLNQSRPDLGLPVEILDYIEA